MSSHLSVFLTPLILLLYNIAPSYSQSGGIDMEYVSQGDVNLGGLFPVHSNIENTCGNILTLGIQRLEAMVHAIQQVNSDQSLLPGITLGYSIKDTCINSNYALEQSLSYVTGHNNDMDSSGGRIGNEGVSGVIGAASSSVSIAVASLFRLFDLPQISYASTAKFLSDKTRFDYFFRTIPPDLFQARVMVDIVVNFNWTYVIAVCSDDTYGLEGIRAFTEELNDITSDNVTFSLAITIKLPLTASEGDYDNAIRSMNNDWVGNASVIVLFGQLATAEGVLRALSRVSHHRAMTLIVSDAVGDQLPSEYHSMGHGMISVLPRYSESESFSRYFTSLRPDANPNPWFKEYWSTVFNCSFNGNNQQSLEQCNSMIDQQIISNEFKQNSKVPFVIDAVYAFAHGLQNLLMNVCGEINLCLKAVLTKDNGVIVNGEMLLKFIKNVSFVSVSGETVSFNDRGDVYGGYSIKNLQRKPNSDDYYFATIGTWNSNTLNLTSTIEWSTGSNIPVSICSLDCSSGQFPRLVEGQASSCWICESCPRSTEVSTGVKCTICMLGYSPNEDKSACHINQRKSLHWSHPFSILILSLALIGLASTLIIGGIFIVNYNHSAIKASSRELSAVLLTGIFLCYVLPFFSIGEPIAITCAIQRFGFGFSFSLCYAALLVKVNRIHRIFNRPRGSGLQRPPLISPSSQLMFTGLLVIIQVILSAAWLVIQQPGSELVYHQDYTEVKCRGTTYLGLAVSLGYNFLLLIISTFYAFRTRKIPQNFNEAKFINLNLYSIIIIWMAFIPAYVGASQLGTFFGTGAQLFAIELSAATTLCSLFVSKLYYLFRSKRKEATAQTERRQSAGGGGTTHLADRRQSLMPQDNKVCIYLTPPTVGNSQCSSLNAASLVNTSQSDQHTTNNNEKE